jgi:hypothetical protein
MRQLQLRFVLPLLAVLGLGLFTAHSADALTNGTLDTTGILGVYSRWHDTQLVEQDYQYAQHWAYNITRSSYPSTTVCSVLGHDHDDCHLTPCAGIYNPFYGYTNYTHIGQDVWVDDGYPNYTAWTSSSYDTYNCIVIGEFQRDYNGNGVWTTPYNMYVSSTIGPLTYGHLNMTAQNKCNGGSGSYSESSTAGTSNSESWRFESTFQDPPGGYGSAIATAHAL